MTLDLDVEEQLAQTRMTRAVFSRLMAQLRPYRRPILLAAFMEAFWVVSMGFNAVIVQRGLERLQDVQGGVPDAWGAAIAAGLFLCNAAFRLVLVIFELRLVNYAGTHFLNDLRDQLFAHAQSLSMRYYDRTKHGRIICRMDRDVESLRQCMVWGPLIFVSAFYSLIVASVIMASYHFRLWLAVAGVLPLLAAASWYFQRRAMAVYRIVREALSGVTAYAAETIQGVRVLQGCSRQALHHAEYCDLTAGFGDKVVRAAVVWNLYLPSISTCYAVAVLVVLGYGGVLVTGGELAASEVVAFIMLIGMFFWPIEGLGELYNHSLSAASAAERIFLLLDTAPEIVDESGAETLDTVKGHLRFENVHFSYDKDGRGDWALRDINLDVPAGSTVALVGPTGSGKSSIVNLATRFYEPVSGRILLDGRDLKSIRLESLHSHMGIVSQDNFLFTGSVGENLCYGSDTATASDAGVVIRGMGADGVLGKLRDGLDTQVLERGAGLSQGERQLICFARAMVADPAILILDEATSAVDAHTETAVQNALEALARNRTTIIVAHRLSTIRNADQILVVRDGRIVERGRHEELLTRRGEYFELYQEYLAKGTVG